MADFYITWPSSRVCGSPGTAGINVGHRAYHPGLAECRLVASREVSLGLCLFTQCLGKAGKPAAWPGGFGSTQVMGMDYKRISSSGLGRCCWGTREVR